VVAKIQKDNQLQKTSWFFAKTILQIWAKENCEETQQIKGTIIGS
jgi:hypothetical protein